MEFFKVDHKMSHPFGCEIVIRMDAEVRVITFVGKERRDSCGCIRRVVVSELSKREEVNLVILIVGDIDTEVSFKGPIYMFHEAVGL